MDRLSTLLSQFGVRARLFHSGTVCSVASIGDPGPYGYLHLLRSGSVTLHSPKEPDLLVTRPSLMFLPRPLPHTMIASEADPAKLLCATLAFDGGGSNPLSASLPDRLVLALDELPMLAETLRWLFEEAAAENCGKEAVLDRLFELLVIQLLRHLLAHQGLSTGMMAGLADPRLSRSLVQMHNMPQRAWTVSELASESNMSRASYAAHFRAVLGQTPADYLLSWRVSLAQKRLLQGRPIALIADEVGYESPSALARAFRRKTGSSPRDWMKSLQADPQSA
ncbi:cupin domain-containing protein [Halomonas sp. A29]|uniref:AraC family transcriptional regulator n=1 Tax=Halomonas sp. A29 TaxID=3102786 RepID=UPI00398B603A